MDASVAGSLHAREARFDTIGWGLLAILVGVMAMPSGTPTYLLAAATGTAMLGLNAWRRATGVPVRWFSIALGAVILAAGLAALAGVEIDVLAAFFVTLGIVVIGGAILHLH